MIWQDPTVFTFQIAPCLWFAKPIAETVFGPLRPSYGLRFLLRPARDTKGARVGIGLQGGEAGSVCRFVLHAEKKSGVSPVAITRTRLGMYS